MLVSQVILTELNVDFFLKPQLYNDYYKLQEQKKDVW